MGEYDLAMFGWDGCTVPANLVEICKYVPTWKDLKVLRTPIEINGLQVRFPLTYFQAQYEKYMPAFIKAEQIDDGGYAQIHKGRRAIFIPEASSTPKVANLRKKTQFQDVCIKEILISVDPDEEKAPRDVREKCYEDEIKCILYEAFLHALLCRTMESVGYPSAVPTMHEVVALTKKDVPACPSDFEAVWITMEFIKGQTLEKFLRSHLKVGNTAENEKIIQDVLIQLAFYLNILQTRLRFNHRDLKVNNVFVRSQSPAWKQTLTLPTGKVWTCVNDIVLIDFGFSCIACDSGSPNPRATLIGAGSWFTPKDDCLKYGRDLAHFLYSLHSLFHLSDYVSAAFFQKLYNAMNVSWLGRSINLFHGLEEDGSPLAAGTELPKPLKFNDGIYIFLRFFDSDVTGCTPVNIIRTICDSCTKT